MNCEVVAVGTELLLGQIVDTNSAWIGEQLALAGIDCLHQVKVGDNLGRIVAAIRQGLDRSDAVLVCGGLGPTQDDITRDAIAQVLGVPLDLDDEVAGRITAMFESRGRRMPANNLRQAEVPRGATAIADPQPGTAPGLICPVGETGGVGGVGAGGVGGVGAGGVGGVGAGGVGGVGAGKVVYAVPGVPYEMQAIVRQAILPDLRRRAGDTSVILSRTLRTWGESESGLAERLAGRIEELDRTGAATIAFLASGIEGLKVRVTVKAADEAAAHEVLAAEEAELRALLGPIVFGVDGDTMESVVAAALDGHGLTIAFAESVTGGLIASRFTDVAGVSAVFRGGLVSYATDVKRDLLEVPDGPVVSAAAVEAMALGVRTLLDADVGLATSGVAGPAEQDGQPVGTVFVGLAMGERPVESVQLRLPGDRKRVRDFAAISALDLLRRRLLDLRGG